jgi:DNA replication ATP-dependent helicase Dna2
MIVAAVVGALVGLCGVAGCDVGVITPYRRQVKAIEAALQQVLPPPSSPSSQAGLEVNTVDRFQGKDCECVVVSLVHANEERGDVGELLRDWRRINVAVTRAKAKLVVVGCVGTLVAEPMLGRLISLCRDQGWLVHLPPHAHESALSVLHHQLQQQRL